MPQNKASWGLDPNGMLAGRIGIREVSGIFVTGATAEAQFTFEVMPSSEGVLAEASRLGLRTVDVVDHPSGGSRRNWRLGQGEIGQTWTAQFRLYDDGWRLWNIR